MTHIDFIERHPNALCPATPRLKLPPQQTLHLTHILLQLLIKSRVLLSRIEKRPAEELLDIIPLDLLLRRIPEPLPQVPRRIRDVVVALLEELATVLAAGEGGMGGGGLELSSARQVDEEIKGRLEDKPFFYRPGDS